MGIKLDLFYHIKYKNCTLFIDLMYIYLVVLLLNLLQLYCCMIWNQCLCLYVCVWGGGLKKNWTSFMCTKLKLACTFWFAKFEIGFYVFNWAELLSVIKIHNFLSKTLCWVFLRYQTIPNYPTNGRGYENQQKQVRHCCLELHD